MVFAWLLDAHAQNEIAIKTIFPTHSSKLHGIGHTTKSWVNSGINDFYLCRICVQMANNFIPGIFRISDDARSHTRTSMHHATVIKTPCARRKILRARQVDDVMNRSDRETGPY